MKNSQLHVPKSDIVELLDKTFLFDLDSSILLNTSTNDMCIKVIYRAINSKET